MAWLVGASSEPSAARYALVVGQNAANELSVASLRYADDDAVAMHELLTQAGVESHLLVTLDEDTRRLHPDLADSPAPTVRAFQTAWATIRERLRTATAAGRPAEFILYFSGHGDVENGEGFVVMSDGRLKRSDVEKLLAESPATTNHVIIDACKSYYLAFGKGAGGERSSFPTGLLTRATKRANVGFILSSSSDRDSHEWERYQAGVFSHEVVSALRGAADTDNDGTITYAELGAFLTAANHSIANARYRPDFLVKPPGDVRNPLLAWAPSGDSLRLDVSELGRSYVEDASGERLLDSHPTSTQALTLHLPAVRPLFVRQAKDGMEYVLNELGAVSLSRLQAAPATQGRKGALHVAFEALFDEPFDQATVDAFIAGYQAARGPLEVHIDVREVDATDWRRGIGWTAVAGVLGGLAMNGWAGERYLEARGASQVRRSRLNGEIGRLNLAAAAFYVVGAIASGTWLMLAPAPETQPN